MPQTRVVRQLPPIELVQPCADPRGALQITGDLLADDQAAHAAIKACAGKVDRLAAWRKASASPGAVGALRQSGGPSK